MPGFECGDGEKFSARGVWRGCAAVLCVSLAVVALCVVWTLLLGRMVFGYPGGELEFVGMTRAEAEATGTVVSVSRDGRVMEANPKRRGGNSYIQTLYLDENGVVASQRVVVLEDRGGDFSETQWRGGESGK